MERNDPTLVRARDLLGQAHNTYVTTVSTQGMALSLETAALAWTLCDSMNPRSILDLGSGFSSYVVRRWSAAASHHVVVWSVDDDPEWLPQSQRFCETQGVSIDNFVLWNNFKDRHDVFDLVIYDLGRMPTRFENVGKAFDFRAPNGVVIVDDMHKFNYGKEVMRVICDKCLVGIDMREATMDKHEGRHCWLVKET